MIVLFSIDCIGRDFISGGIVSLKATGRGM